MLKSRTSRCADFKNEFLQKNREFSDPNSWVEQGTRKKGLDASLINTVMAPIILAWQMFLPSLSRKAKTLPTRAIETCRRQWPLVQPCAWLWIWATWRCPQQCQWWCSNLESPRYCRRRCRRSCCGQRCWNWVDKFWRKRREWGRW